MFNSQHSIDKYRKKKTFSGGGKGRGGFVQNTFGVFSLSVIIDSGVGIRPRSGVKSLRQSCKHTCESRVYPKVKIHLCVYPTPARCFARSARLRGYCFRFARIGEGAVENENAWIFSGIQKKK